MYKLKYSDLSSDLEGIPSAVIRKMLEMQVEQGNEPNALMFAYDIAADKAFGGFTWEETEDGHIFWREILLKKDYGLFFDRYNCFPKVMWVWNKVNERRKRVVVGYKDNKYIAIGDAETIDDAFGIGCTYAWRHATELFEGIEQGTDKTCDEMIARNLERKEE